MVVPHSTLLAAERQPVIAVIGEASLRDQSALLITSLAKNHTVTFVEREELERVLEEQKLDAQGLTSSNSIHIGQLLHADGLLIMRKSRATPSRGIDLRLVAVRPGIVLSEESYTDGVFTAEGINTVISPELTIQWPKLLIAPESAIPISLGGIHSTIGGMEMKKWERELSLLLEHRLLREPSLFVLDRKSIELLMAEKQWDDQNTGLMTGRVVLEGRVEKAAEKLRISVQIKQPAGKQVIELNIEGSTGDLPSLADNMAVAILGSLKAKPMAGNWSAIEEAKIYHGIASWALDHHLLDEAQEAAESAWALGLRGDALNELRMKAYCAGAFPNWGTHRCGSFANSYSFYGVDVRKEPERLEAAIRATEILLDHLETQPLTQEDYSAFNDRGDSNYDYRILSASVLLNVSRLLRCFYEDDATHGHLERLAYLRKLVREAIDILICKETGLDERQMWVYRIQSAYAAYIYEKPEEVVKVYQSLIQRNIEGWMIKRDPASGVWGPACQGQSDDCIRHRRPKNTLTPYVIGWSDLDEARAQVVWAKFMQKLKASEKPQDQAAFWVFSDITKLSQDDQKSLREFLWKSKVNMIDLREQNFIWKQMGAVYLETKPTKEECIRFYEYLMRDGVKVEELFAHGLLDQSDFSEEDIKRLSILLEEYLARVGKQLPSDEAKNYVKNAKHWIGMSLEDSYIAWKKNGYSEPVKQEPPLKFPKPMPGSMPVTKFWSSWTQLEGDLLGADLDGFQYVDGKIWCYDTRGCGKIISIDLKTYEKVIITAPTPKYRSIDALAIGDGKLFAAWDGGVQYYEFETGKWTSINVPSSHYSLEFIDGYCYLLFGDGNFLSSFDTSKNDDASGVYRYDARNGELKLLTSTRRRPALCELDSIARYKPVRISKTKAGILYLEIETDRDGLNHSFYKSNIDQEGWKMSFSIQINSKPVIQEDPGGLLCETGIRKFQYYPELGGSDFMKTILVQSESNKQATIHELTWQPPKRVIEHPNKFSIRSATEGFGSFWILSTQEAIISDWYMEVHPVLHRYRTGDSDPVDIALDFQIPEIEQQRISALAVKSSDIEQVASSLHQTVVPRIAQISRVIAVPDGFVFQSWYGFWYLSLRDLENHISKSISSKSSSDHDRHE